MKFNLNEEVQFVLTVMGQRIWEGHLEEMARESDERARIDMRQRSREKHLERSAALRAEKIPGPTKMALFQFMRLFGPFMGPGKPPLVEDLTIDLFVPEHAPLMPEDKAFITACLALGAAVILADIDS